MNYYCITKPSYSSDYEAVITNGFAYSNESSGYYDLIKKGYPGPVDPRTILAELYSINVPPILWSTWTCAFLITDKLLSDFKKIGFSGYEAIPVEIAKVATKGKLRGGKKEYAGEPEDLILNRKNYLKELTVRSFFRPVLKTHSPTGCKYLVESPTRIESSAEPPRAA